jgi:hypothetical protein
MTECLTQPQPAGAFSRPPRAQRRRFSARQRRCARMRCWYRRCNYSTHSPRPPQITLEPTSTETMTKLIFVSEVGCRADELRSDDTPDADRNAHHHIRVYGDGLHHYDRELQRGLGCGDEECCVFGVARRRPGVCQAQEMHHAPFAACGVRRALRAWLVRGRRLASRSSQ